MEGGGLGGASGRKEKGNSDVIMFYLKCIKDF